MTERRSKLLVVAAVWLSFLVVSLLSAPIPAVNEPHYLAMARHSWNSSWCANDLFLSSFPAHQVFYWTIPFLSSVHIHTRQFPISWHDFYEMSGKTDNT